MLLQAEPAVRRRLWWCPTGVFAFLPIHASGYYADNIRRGKCSTDFFSSSYIATIGSLLDARKRHRAQPIHVTAMRVLLAGVTVPCSGSRLDGVATEVLEVKRQLAHLRRGGASQSLQHPPVVTYNARKSDVLESLPTSTIMHLACHGSQDQRDALNSAFTMSDDRLRVADLLALDLRGAFLAFLSACESARADLKQPNEALSLAETLMFAGFRSVVGTMW